LEKDPPYGAKVIFTLEKQGSGWESPALKPWLEEAIKEASVAFFNKPHVCIMKEKREEGIGKRLVHKS
jgi:hypothetical protein